MTTSAPTIEKDPYPSSDGKPMAETDVHVTLMADLLAILRRRFRAHDDVYVAANMFLYYVKGDVKKRRAPDVMVIKGVKGKHQRRSFKIWVEKAVPSCIIELTSKQTAREDLKVKKPLYRRLGVREYFLFDPYKDYLPRQLMGFRLVGRKYEEMECEEDGSIVSAELGLRLRPEGRILALYDLKTGERLLNLDEMSESLDEAQQELEDARRRNAELQAEIARLKAAKNGSAS